MDEKVQRLFLIFFFLIGLNPSSSTAADKNEIKFDGIIKKIQAVYSPIVVSAGGNLVVNSFWESDVLNGFADRQNTNWIVEVHGGFYRHEKVTDDGLVALICHELGHHLGGMPFQAHIPWMSSEGQADFYSASICLRQVWDADNNLSAFKNLTVPDFLKEQCKLVHKTSADAALCVRIAMAGYSFVEFNRVEHGYASESKPVNFESTAPALTGPALNYPRAQCRLDTFLAGALNKSRPSCWFLEMP